MAEEGAADANLKLQAEATTVGNTSSGLMLNISAADSPEGAIKSTGLGGADRKPCFLQQCHDLCIRLLHTDQ